MIGRAIDNLIGVFAPAWGLRRTQARGMLSQVEKLVGGVSGGYDAAKLSRLTRYNRGASETENSIPREEIARLRWQSWNLYRNNPHAKKIVRTLEAKVIGTGLAPRSQTVREDGSPHNEYRKRVAELWKQISGEIDWRGKPGFGGQSMADIQRSGLRASILSGEVLYRFRALSAEEQKSSSLILPLTIQLIHADRLTSPQVDDSVFAGIELDGDGRRVAYHIQTSSPTDTAGINDTARIPADQVGHLFVQEDIDQLRGTPWLSATLLKMRDTGDYEFNELTAARMAACVVLGYRRSMGQTQFGVDAPDDWDLTDNDGNKITNITPGMFVDLGQSGELTGFNPQRPNSGAVDFITHLLYSQANSVPGVKGSTLSADYRRASFASERSADNDTWPEIEVVQRWFAEGFCQPTFEQILSAAFAEGFFDGIVSVGEYRDNRREFEKAEWQGPVGRSINPKDDAVAAQERIRNGTSTPQREAALLGRDALDMLKEIREYVDAAEELDLPGTYVNQSLGFETTVDISEDNTVDEGADNGNTPEENDATPAKKDAAA